MAQFFGIEEIKELTKSSQTTLTWTSGSNLRIGGQAYKISSNLILDLATDIDTGSASASTIYYVYAVVVAGVVSLKYSLSSSAPTGIDAYRKIGSFRTDSIVEIAGTSIKDQGRVGDIIHSMLTEEQFIAENGSGWVLADGRNVAGSKYASLIALSVPDMRGQFLRGKNNGRSDGNEDPAGERAVGNFQEDAMQGHKHQSYGTSGGGVNTGLLGPSTGNSNGNYQTALPVNDGVNGTPRTASETRPKNVTINIFIKVEDITL